MQVPVELHTSNVHKSADLEELIERRIAKLEKFHDHLTSCRISIERPHQHPSSGSGYRVRLDITAPPGHELVVKREPHEGEANDSLTTVINRAFQAAERQVKELAERQRHEVKTHDVPRALVVRLFKDQGYGFIKTPEGREIYFHQNSVVGDFGRLSVGTEVRFEETMGDMGPQATTVQIVAKVGVRSQGGAGADGADGAADEPGAASEPEPALVSPPAGWGS